MITVIIMEDEPVMLEALQRAVDTIQDVKIIDAVSTGQDCVDLLERKPDLLLLDIKAPDMSGIEVARIALQRPSPPLIAFITGYEEFAVQAFELGVLDYIVKTDDTEKLRQRLQQTIQRAKQRLAQTSATTEKPGDGQQQQTDQPPPIVEEKLPVKDYDERTIRLIDVEAIVCAERHGRKVVIQTQEAEYPTYYTVSRLQQRLKNVGFFRVNRAAVVNIDYVEHLVPCGDGSYDIIFRKNREAGPRTLNVTRSRAAELKQALGLSDATSGS